jgi:hypothetical protein
MNYLSMLKDLKSNKNISNFQETDTSKTTETIFVGFVAPNSSSTENICTQIKPLMGFDPSLYGDPLLVLLLELGEQICDYWNDSEEARAEMVADILAYPLHQRKALLTALGGSLKTETLQVG